MLLIIYIGIAVGVCLEVLTEVDDAELSVRITASVISGIIWPAYVGVILAAKARKTL